MSMSLSGDGMSMKCFLIGSSSLHGLRAMDFLNPTAKAFTPVSRQQRKEMR
jgi:hypothetical protein